MHFDWETEGFPTVATDQLRADALSCGAAAAEISCAIATLRPPQHYVDDASIDLGNRAVVLARPGRGHTDADLVVLASGIDGGRSVVFTGDLVEESGDRRSMLIPTSRTDRSCWTVCSRSVDRTPSMYPVTAAPSTWDLSADNRIG